MSEPDWEWWLLVLDVEERPVNPWLAGLGITAIFGWVLLLWWLHGKGLYP
jgi:hypothetical protein